MTDTLTRQVNRSLFAYRVVDVHSNTFGFSQDGTIYTYVGDSKTRGEAWLRMQRTGERGRDRRKYFLYFGDEAEYSAVVNKHNDIYDLEGHYIASLVHSRFIIILFLFLGLVICLTSIAGYLGGSVIMDSTAPFADENTINLTISDEYDDWTKTSELDIFAVRNEDDEIINERRSILKAWPGLKGHYQYLVANKSETPLYYKTTFADENTYGIPIQFKLIKGTKYIVGDEDTWVDIKDFNLPRQKIDPNEEVVYTIEWQWTDKDDVHDTKLGLEAIAQYVLHLRVDYEATT